MLAHNSYLGSRNPDSASGLAETTDVCCFAQIFLCLMTLLECYLISTAFSGSFLLRFMFPFQSTELELFSYGLHYSAA
jgi:hypothetical protein